MFNLFLRTFSQGLQAFMPVAASLAWFRRGDRAIASAIRWGAVIAMPVTVVATWAFRRSATKALDEAVLAMLAAVIAIAFVSIVWRRRGFEPDVHLRRHIRALVGIVLGTTCLLVVRQTMEIGSVFQAAAVELRSFPATAAVTMAAFFALVLAWFWIWIARRLPARDLESATRTFTVVFVIQVLIYAFHESAEAHLLPWSDVLHSATEPYGPDGIYGMHLSELLVALPLAAAALGLARRKQSSARTIALTCLLSMIVGIDFAGGGTASTRLSEDLASMTGRPHLLFRDTSNGSAFGTLSVAPLDSLDRDRGTTGLLCDRVSFSSGSGLCLHPEKGFFGLFTSYTALVLDRDLKPRGAPIKLEGRPSRTRVGHDGRIGAITVFVVGDDYATSFSTRTALIDLAKGTQIADLEEFTTWRNGESFRSRDFNFWGVTFAHDGNTFYASLRTAGATYLVRGELASRKLTVLRDNVECPSLSPDDRRIVFKKNVGPDPGAWRLAVLDVPTMKEHLIAGETRYIDDQAEWLDADHVLYAITRRTTSSADVWVAAIDGASPAKVYLPQAESPVIVR